VPAEVQEHEHDADGRLIRTAVTREAEWDDDERALMLALVLYEDQLCPSGHWLPESAAAENEYGYRGRSSRCHACATVAREAQKFMADPNPASLLVGAQLKVKKRGGAG